MQKRVAPAILGGAGGGQHRLDFQQVFLSSPVS